MGNLIDWLYSSVASQNDVYYKKKGYYGNPFSYGTDGDWVQQSKKFGFLAYKIYVLFVLFWGEKGGYVFWAEYL